MVPVTVKLAGLEPSATLATLTTMAPHVQLAHVPMVLALMEFWAVDSAPAMLDGQAPLARCVPLVTMVPVALRAVVVPTLAVATMA